MPKLDPLFVQLKNKGSSDLHLSVGYPPLMRSKGNIHVLEPTVLTNDMLKTLLYEIMTDSHKAAFESCGDLDFAYALEGVARFRANVFMTYRGLAAVFRIIPTDIKRLDDMGVPPVIKKLAEVEKGLVLVTGATGSGKSTTLSAMINHINETREAHIITIEEPIEFVHPSKKCLITQREIHWHARSFSSALKAACREDPDVILVGEMRDYETISLALAAAELGVLVYGTLHTNSAARTIERIIDVFPTGQQPQARTQLADALKGVIAQQLIKRADGKGLIAAHEVMIGGPALGNIIREGKTSLIQSYIQTGSTEGMILMDQTLANLVQTMKIDKSEGILRASDKKMLEKIEPRAEAPASTPAAAKA